MIYLEFYWYKVLSFFRNAWQQLRFSLGERKRLLGEIEELNKILSKNENKSFEEYFNANTFLSTATGLELQFKGKELVKILAACFWKLVKEADNFIICDVNNHLGDCVKIIITKAGKLTPSEKLKAQEAEIKELKLALEHYRTES